MTNDKKDEEKDPMDNVRFKQGKRFGHWTIEKTLDEGGFGQVYLVKNEEGKRAALKAESNDVEGGSAIKLETMILKRLNQDGPVPHVPELYVAAKRKKYCYMVMTLLGENLKSLKQKNGDKFSRGTWSRVGIQCLYSLKYMHDCGFVHRDIKPQNFMMGHEQDKERARLVHILDFGLARSYAKYDDKAKKWEARRARGSAEFRGTLRYTSPNVHMRMEQGRGDDIWSLLFVIIELNGGLPWQTVQKRDDVELVKLNMSNEYLMEKMPKEMYCIPEHLRTLDYYMRPDYHLIFKCMWDVMLASKNTPKSRYDWESKDIDTSIYPTADWENDKGVFFKADPVKINGPPPFDRNAAETTHMDADVLLSDKGKSLNQKKKSDKK